MFRATRISIFALTLMASTLATQSASAQSAEDAYRFAERFPASGAVQLGLAGASRAGLADWTSVTTNPAGLGWMKRGQLVGSVNSWSVSDDATYNLGEFSSFGVAQTNATHFGNGGWVYKAPVARGSSAFAIGYNQTNSFQRDLVFSGDNGSNSITDFFMPVPGEFELFFEDGEDGRPGTGDDFVTPEFSRSLSFLAFETFAIDLDQGLVDDGDPVPFLPAVVRGTVEQTGDVYEEGTAGEFTMAGAWEASEGVMIGLGVNLASGSYRFNRFFRETDVNNDNDGTGITTDFESLQFNEFLETDLFGVNFRSGFSAQVTPALRLGGTVETPTWYSVEEDFEMSLSTTFDNGDVFTERLSGVNRYDLRTPWRFGGGAAYTLSKLTISADAEYVDWTQLEMTPDGSSNDLFLNDINRNIRRDYRSVVNANFGAQLKLGLITLRGGYAMQPDPRPTEVLDRSKEYYSAGIGFTFQKFLNIDIGWTRESFDDRYQPYFEVDGAPVVTESVSRDRLAIGLRIAM